ncbi:nischarin-like isoform X3 [Asterias amurensis]|uniref:nischarin-like isoform X3 n=1 Tax=Asterias amurensis TaxID=7602 RepID=UPI003AB22C1E
MWITNRVVLLEIPHVILTSFDYMAYVIEIIVGDCKWTIQRRYSEFHDLHEKLVALKKVEKAQLPPKKYLRNQAKSFVEKRRHELEVYLQTLLDESNYLVTPLLHFLEFDIYDIYGVSQALATELFEKGDAIVASDDVCEMTPMQLYAITERMKLALPTCAADDVRSDIGHIMDFITRLKLMRIVGSRNKLGSSSRTVDQLPFDLSKFNNLEYLQIDVCTVSLIEGLSELKKTLRYLAVHHTVKSIKEIILPEGDHWTNLEAAGPSNGPPSHVPTWKFISRADFRYNNLNEIDDSIKLLPSLTRLDLSHNNITEINNLQYLSYMTHLDLSHNNISSLEGVHARLGNITSLSLAGNELTSLKGLGKLYSLVQLDVSKNCIEHVLEVNYISNLPCIESLNLKDNPITSIMDYRTKVLDLFQDQYVEMTLDGIKTSQKEIDKVAILKAIQKAKDGKTKKLGMRKESPMRKRHNLAVNQADIADPTQRKASLSTKSVCSMNSQYSLAVPGDEASVSSAHDAEFRAKVEEIRREGGEAWLTMLNELQEAPHAKPDVVRARGRSSPGKGRSPKGQRKEFRDSEDKEARPSTRSPARSDFQHPSSPTLKISPKALLHCIFDELARHQAEGINSIPELIFHLHIYFRGPVLCTYGPRHLKDGVKEPEVQGPSIRGYLEQMAPETQKEFVDLLHGLTSGKVQLPSHIFPKLKDAAEVLVCVLKVLGLEEKSIVDGARDKLMSEEVMKLQVSCEDNLQKEKKIEREVAVVDAARMSVVSPAITISEHESPVYTKPSRSSSPRIIPTYDALSLENLTQCNQQIGIELSEPMKVIADMQATELIKYFHDNIAEIVSEPEKLTHVVWVGAIAFQRPSVEISACVMLSDRAVYILSADSSKSQVLSPPVEVRGHRRMNSDSVIKEKLKADSKKQEQISTAGFNGGQVLKSPHASGVLVTATENKSRKRVKCQHILKLTDIAEVDVGLFDQKLRLTAKTAADTVSLLTRNFQVTLGFLEWLMQVLPISSGSSKSPDRSQQVVDPYKLHRSYTEEFLHPSSVKFSYPNDETINDLTYLIVACIKDPKISIERTSILLYMLVYQVHPIPNSPIAIREPLHPCEKSHRTLVVTDKHLTLCREDHVSYPLPSFTKVLPENPQYEILEVQALEHLRRLVVSDFSSRDVTLVFEVMDVVVDITMDHYGSRESGEGKVESPALPEIAWTLVLPSFEDRERLRKQLCHTWQEIHGQELSIQVNT